MLKQFGTVTVPAMLLILLALLGGCQSPGGRQVINARRPLGPYSGAIRVGNTVWVSGHLGLDPATGELVPGGVGAETRRTLESLREVLEEAGFGLSDVVRATVFLTDIGDYAAMNEVYAEFFKASPPARACVEVSGLVKGARVEISCVAAR